MRIFSGIQPTGTKHLGNFIGAIRQYVEGQARGDPAIYCIVDLHAITVPYEPAQLRERVLDTTALLLAAGLDPERCVLFYPVLMAADVLAYRADEVPVGEDQREHLELMRDAARRFNARFGEGLLVVPEHRIPTVGARIMDLQEPTRKMSTSGGSVEGTVYVLDDRETVGRKLKRAVTDSEDPFTIRRDPVAKPGVTNLLDITAAARGVDPEAVVAELAGARGYGDLKLAAAEAIVALLAPVRERYAALRADEAYLEAVLDQGAVKARALAAPVVAEVRAAMGFGPRGR